jgi:hypothetical protein
MGRPRGTGNRADRIIELNRKGLSAVTIAARLGLKNSDYVNQVLRAESAKNGGSGSEMEDFVSQS